MDNLYKLAEHLLEEADKLAMAALVAPHHEKHKHIDVVLKYCDAHADICESLEFHEDWEDGADDNPGGMLDNPGKSRRRRRR